MPKYGLEDTPEDVKASNKRSCAGLRDDLLECLLASDCVRKDRITPRECLKEGKAPPDCVALSQAFYACKRSLFDMRQRFRGTKGY